MFSVLGVVNWQKQALVMSQSSGVCAIKTMSSTRLL